jgi:DNA-binding NarL/FixJ family response regulator
VSLTWDENNAAHAIVDGTMVECAPQVAFTAALAPSACGAVSLERTQSNAAMEQANYLACEQKQRPTVAYVNDRTNSTISAILPVTMGGALTDRQRDVLQLIVQGLSNKEIARTLNIAHGTVKVHVAALFGKLGVHRRAAVAVAGARFLAEATLTSAPAWAATARRMARGYERQRLHASAPLALNRPKALRQIA